MPPDFRTVDDQLRILAGEVRRVEVLLVQHAHVAGRLEARVGEIAFIDEERRISFVPSQGENRLVEVVREHRRRAQDEERERVEHRPVNAVPSAATTQLHGPDVRVCHGWRLDDDEIAIGSRFQCSSGLLTNVSLEPWKS